MPLKLDLVKLKRAAEDLRSLLDRSYPPSASLEMVVNRYALKNVARQILHRGVCARSVAQSRRAKLCLLCDLSGQPLAVDGHVVLITVECAWRGLPLVAADDGFIRDAAQIYRALNPPPHTDKVLHLLAEYLAKHQVGPLRVFFDAHLSYGRQLAKWTEHIWSDWGLTVEVAVVPGAEDELVDFPGFICTSDTALIDLHPEVVDLAGEFIRHDPAWQRSLIFL